MENLFNMKNPLTFMKLLTPNPFTLRHFFIQKKFVGEQKFVKKESSSGLGHFIIRKQSFIVKQSFVLVILAVLFIASCKDKPDEVAPAAQTAAEDSVSNENIDTVLSDEAIALFSQSGFSTFAKSKSPAFDWSKFRLMNSWKEDSLYVTPFEPASNYYETYKPYLKYSPDSSMFIDLDSYNLALEKDKNGQQVAIESGPDTEVSLVNIKEKKKTRLVFL